MTPAELAGFVRELRANGIEVTVDGGKLRVEPWSELEPIEQEALRRYRDDLLVLLANEQAQGQNVDDVDKQDAQRHQDREVWAYHLRITRHHVAEMLGEEPDLLDRFQRGDLSPAEVDEQYGRTRAWMRQRLELASRGARPFSPMIYSPPSPTQELSHARKHQGRTRQVRREHRNKPVLR